LEVVRMSFVPDTRAVIPALSDPEAIEARIKAVGRSCGACSMCCHILGVEELPALSKPPDQWCPHCKPGKGRCTIYEHRPRRCRNFYCQWLVDASLDDSWFPLNSGIVIYASPNSDGSICQMFEVDARRPDRWLQPRYFELISKIAALFQGTTVRAGKRWFIMVPSWAAQNPQRLVLPPGVERVIPGKVGPSIIKTPDGDFEWIEIEPTPEFATSGWKEQAS
jgi:hypothetical protein